MNTKLELVFFILAGVAVLLGAFWIIRTEQRLKKFFRGNKAKDLEETILGLQDEIKMLDSSRIRADAQISELKNKLAQSIRGLETIRFNPFSDQGSNQSFAISMLNEEGDGVVLSSLYSRERMSVFAKPIKGGKSEYELTEEEKETLWKAKEKIQQKMQ